MPDRERKQSTTAAELAVLLAAGDNRAAAARARQVPSGSPLTVPDAPPGPPHRGSRGRAKRESDGDHTSDQGVAREALSRVKPERAVALVFAACLALLVLATILGLREIGR